MWIDSALIDVFLRIHDPTTLNRQGNDSGTQYRSIILYVNEDQKKEAREAIESAEKEKVYQDKIVTQLSKLEMFYVAEANHQNFYNENTEHGYCRAIIKPKLGKLSNLFKDMVDEKATKN